MNKHSQQVDIAYDLERRLAGAIEKIRENITRSKALKDHIRQLQRGRRPLEAVPEEVQRWFEETSPYLEEEEEGEERE